MRSLLLLVFLLLPWPAAAQGGSTSHAIDQARLFIRKGWHEDAHAELMEALATPEGSQSFEVHWLLSQVSYELLMVGPAVDHARVAAGLTEDADKSAECWQLVEFYEGTYGSVQVIGPQQGLKSRLQLELQTTLFDPELTRYVKRKTLDLTESAPLPRIIWLPAGDYLINGQALTVTAGKEATLRLPLSALGAKGMAALQVPRVELGGGFGVLFGARVANLHPSIETQLSVTQPLGRLLLGLTLDKSFRSYDVEGYGPAHSPAAFSGGLRLGTELLVGGPLAFRPFLGYRYGLLPGISFDCRDTQQGLSCAPELEPNGVTDRFYATARAHIAAAELSIDYRDGGRTNAMGIGIRAGVDQVFGSVSESSRGAYTDLDDAEPMEITLQDGSIHATGIRLLVNLSIAL